MVVPLHHTDRRIEVQPASVVGDTWTTAVVPRLPADLAAQAPRLTAFQRVRGVATPPDLLRAVLADVLGAWSTRRLGAWAVLMGLADIAEAAWRKRLRASNAWRLWLLGTLIAAPRPAARPPMVATRRGLWLEATRVRQPGGTGDDWRVHGAYDFTAGCMSDVVVTDQHSAERLAHFTLQPRDMAVADHGYGYRASGATAVRRGADIVTRSTPAPFPVETDAGEPCDLLAWLHQSQSPALEWAGWCVPEAQRYALRVLAVRLPPAAAARARQRQYQPAQQKGRTPSAATVARADWVLVVTTLGSDWTLEEIMPL